MMGWQEFSSRAVGLGNAGDTKWPAKSKRQFRPTWGLITRLSNFSHCRRTLCPQVDRKFYTTCARDRERIDVQIVTRVCICAIDTSRIGVMTGTRRWSSWVRYKWPFSYSKGKPTKAHFGTLRTRAPFI